MKSVIYLLKNKYIANSFNEYFGSIVESLDLHTWTEGSKALPTCANYG